MDWNSERAKTPEWGGEISELAVLEQIRTALAAEAETRSHEGPTTTESISHGPLFRWGKLEVMEHIGQGTFGDVYRAYDPALQSEFALKLRKVPDPAGDSGTERFLSEARRLARVRHRNVVTVHGVETHDGRAGIWTEFIHGQTLEACVEDQGPWNAREAAIAGIDLCHALAAVHAAGLIHRDVKTTNVMRERGGRIVLMDFGSGGELPRDGQVRTSRHIQGTPLVMAPEQLRGQVAGPATDVYGLGVLLYWLVSKSLPVEGGTIGEIMERHARKERKTLRDRRPNLPSDFVQVVERALEHDPAARFPTAGAMELALARTLAWKRPLPWRRIAVGVAGIAAVGLLAWGLRDQMRNQEKPAAVAIRTPAAPLTATASLFRHTDAADERLLPGARVAPGDRLFMSLQGSDSMFVYILNEDEAGNMFVLFPIRGLSPENPLAPGARQRLPERWGDDPAYWRITSAGGKESIIAIASRTPLASVEQEIERFPRAQLGRPIEYPKISAEALHSLRGIGGVEAEPLAAEKGPRRLSAALKALGERRQGVDEPWVWQTELDNPRSAP